MPRKQKDPIVEVMQYFETVSPESAKTALEVVTEIVRRRTTVRPGKPGKAEQQLAPPMRSRAEEAAVQTPEPPKAKVRTGRAARPMQITDPGQIVGGLPGIQATVGE